MPTPRKEENECEETSPKRIKLEEQKGTGNIRQTLTYILEKEIKNEINIRRGDLEIIEQRIFQTRQSLVKIRQGIVAEYYKQNSKTILQAPPHPAVKDTFLGKCPAKNSYFNDHTEYKETETNNITLCEESANNFPENGCNSQETPENKHIVKLPRYVPPKYREKDIVQLGEPRGNVKKKKFRLAIGNVSKWIFDEHDQTRGATHKWTVYLKNSDPAVNISNFVSKVTFYLHHSYKPNDVITVDYAPFKLSRRGWGEFPLRVQIHFISSLDKPVDVIHQLKLDTTHSGLDTFGGETIIDVWAHCDDTVSNDTQLEQTDSGNNDDDTPSESISAESDDVQPTSSNLSVDTAYVTADDYLSASALSELTLPPITAEITNDILSEIFGDNEELKIKDEPKDVELHSTSTEIKSTETVDTGCCTASTTPVISDDNTLPSNKSEYIFDEQTFTYNTSSSTLSLNQSPADNVSPVVEKETSLIETQQHMINELLNTEDECIQTINTISTLPPGDNLSDNINTSLPILSQSSSSSTDIAYDPIECFNFVNDEVVIKSEDSIPEVSHIKEDDVKPTISCRDYLENFVDSEINNDEFIFNVKQEVTVTDDEGIGNSQESCSATTILSQSNDTCINGTLSTENRNKSVNGLTLIENSDISVSNKLCGKVVNVTCLGTSVVHGDTVFNLIKDNTTCLNKDIPHRINKSNEINLSNIENNVIISKNKNFNNKWVIKDTNNRNVKNVIIPSPSNNNLTQTKSKIIDCSSNNSFRKPEKTKNESLILIKNSSVLGKQIKNVITKNNVFNVINDKDVQSRSTEPNRVISINPSVKNKLYIEMPNGQLKEISSSSTTTQQPVSNLGILGNHQHLTTKPIIVEPHAVNKRKFNLTNTTNTASTELKLLQIPEQSVKKITIQPTFKIIKTTNLAQINHQSTHVKNFTASCSNNSHVKNVIRTINPKGSKKNNSLLKSSSIILQTGMNSSTVSPKNSQCFKIVTGSVNQDSKNVLLHRKVMPGESLLKKGNIGSTQQENDKKNPQLVSSSFQILSDKDIISRCPRENVEFAISWLIKQCPLLNEKAGIEYFKTKHPYCAVDRDTFLKWPFARQRAAEWMRAKKVSRLLAKVYPQENQWSTLQVIDWARLRGYTPLGQSFKCNNALFTADDSDISFSFTAPDLSAILNDNIEIIEEKVIDVESFSDNEETKISNKIVHDRIYISLEKNLQNLGEFIFKSCDKLGIHFYEEELIPGIVYPAAERMLISVFNSLVDDLFRRSLNASCMRSKSVPPTEVIVEDVKTALLSRSEFDIFTNEGLGACTDGKENNHEH